MTTSAFDDEAMLIRLSVRWLRLPLARPYLLAFGSVSVFDVFLTEATFADGSMAYGEATPLPGYSDETPESVWDDLNRCASSPESVRPFARAALLAPGEWLALRRCARRRIEVPLVGTVMEHERARIEADVHRLLSAGHRTLKLKVGLDLERDLAHVDDVQSAVRAWRVGRAGDGEGVRLRVDANQGYDLATARRFLERIDPSGIELFEQPFPADRWDWCDALGPSPVPIMLDESIASAADVDRAATIAGVGYVKFKLMKAGGGRALVDLIERARASGLAVVLGNGVAADVGCATEALVAAAVGLETAGEMNGFLKLRRPLSIRTLGCDGGRLRLDPADALRLDRDAVEAQTVAHEVVFER